MTSIGERVRMIRKSEKIHMTLEKFGEKIGLKKNSLSQIENGVNSLTEPMKLAICREFGVDQTWLETGEGNMFESSSGFSLDDFARLHEIDDLEMRILKVYFEMDPKIRRSMITHFKTKLSDHNDKEPTSLDRDGLIDNLNRQLDLEESRAAES